MDKKVIRSGRMTKIQKECLVSFLEDNKYLLETKIKPFELEKFNNKWRELADHLNNQMGAKKTVSQWKDALNEFKVSTRRKARLINLEHTGGGPKKEIDLTDLEERLLALLSKIVIVGAPVPEVGLETNKENLDTHDEYVIEEMYVDNIQDEYLTVKTGTSTSGNTPGCSSGKLFHTPKQTSESKKKPKTTKLGSYCQKP